VVRVLADRNAILDRQERAKRERIGRRQQGIEIAPQVGLDRLKRRWAEVEVQLRCDRGDFEQFEEREEREPLRFRRRA
jgi:hypothetical protein